MIREGLVMERLDVKGVALGEKELVREKRKPAWSNYPGTLVVGPFFLGIPLIYAWYKRRYVNFIVTNERLIKQTRSPFGSTSTTEHELARIERIETHQSFLDRMFGAGSLTIRMRHSHHEAETFEVELGPLPGYVEVGQTLRNEAGVGHAAG